MLFDGRGAGLRQIVANENVDYLPAEAFGCASALMTADNCAARKNLNGVALAVFLHVVGKSCQLLVASNCRITRPASGAREACRAAISWAHFLLALARPPKEIK